MPPKVLVVDDDDLVLDLAQDALSSSFEVFLASSPREAIALASAQQFSVICSDYAMPEMNGGALLARLATENPGARTLLLTGSDVESAKASRHAFAVVTKPFRPTELRDLVDALSCHDVPRANRIVETWNTRTARRTTPQSS